jgi:hypothetical protein
MKVPSIVRLLSAILVTIVAAMPISHAFAAERVVQTITEYTDQIIGPLPTAIDASCVGGVGAEGQVTFLESGITKLTETVSGPQAGSFHLMSRYAGTFTMVLGDQSYSGAYRGTYDEQFSRDTNVRGFSVRATSTRPDGSPILWVFQGHLTLKQGTVTRDIQKVTCVK